MQSKIGEIYEGKVTGLTKFGAFVKMSNGDTGMVHISEVSSVYVKEISDHLTEGQDVKVKVLAVNDNNKISLSIKQTEPKPAEQSSNSRQNSNYQRNSGKNSQRSGNKPSAQSSAPMSFEDMMAKFKQESDEKMSVLKRTGDFKTGNRRGYGNK